MCEVTVLSSTTSWAAGARTAIAGATMSTLRACCSRSSLARSESVALRAPSGTGVRSEVVIGESFL